MPENAVARVAVSNVLFMTILLMSNKIKPTLIVWLKKSISQLVANLGV